MFVKLFCNRFVTKTLNSSFDIFDKELNLPISQNSVISSLIFKFFFSFDSILECSLKAMLLVRLPLVVICLSFDGNWEDIGISSDVDVSFALDKEITLEREVPVIVEEKYVIPLILVSSGSLQCLAVAVVSVKVELLLCYSWAFIGYKEGCKWGFPAGMDALQMHLSDVSYSLLETSQRGLICKFLRRLPGD